MGKKLDIPLVFTPTDPAMLKRDLERFATAMDRYVRTDAPAEFVISPKPNRSGILSFDMVTRVALTTGDSLTLQLPQPDVTNGGRALYIKREGTTGTCTIRGVGALIGGRPTKVLPAAPGLYAIFFDGANYYPMPALAAAWGDGIGGAISVPVAPGCCFSVAGTATDGFVIESVAGTPTWVAPSGSAISAIVPHDTTFSPIGLWQLSGSLTDTGSGATALTANSVTQYAELWPALKGWDGLGGNGFHSTAVSPAALALTGDMTIEAFVRSPDNLRGLGSKRSIICFDTNAGGSSVSNILYSIGISTGGFPEWIQQHGSNVSDTYTLTTDIFPSGLFHLAVTRTSDVIQMYVNGVPLGAASGTLTTATGGSGSSFRFGTQGGAPLAVALASLKVIGSALTAAQVKAEYNRTFGPVFGMRA